MVIDNKQKSERRMSSNKTEDRKYKWLSTKERENSRKCLQKSVSEQLITSKFVLKNRIKQKSRILISCKVHIFT